MIYYIRRSPLSFDDCLKKDSAIDIDFVDAVKTEELSLPFTVSGEPMKVKFNQKKTKQKEATIPRPLSSGNAGLLS